MPAVVAKRTYDIAEADDPKAATIEYVGDISGFVPVGTTFFIGNYIRSVKIGNLYRPPGSVAEDEWQGNVGLVLKFGDGFNEDAIPELNEKFLHKWVKFHYNDGDKFHFNGVSVRIIDIGRIRAIVPDPSKVL